MTIGGKTQQQAIEALSRMTDNAVPIDIVEYAARIKVAQEYMVRHDIDATYLNAGSNLTYFTGTKWNPSERMVGAVLPAIGDPVYIAPAFERSTIQKYMVIPGDIAC